MSISKIPLKVRFKLWARSAGRCQYCNVPLWEDIVTKAQYSTAYVAHIIADQPDGPRGHPTLSKELKSEFSNLMLLCDAHHRLIDDDEDLYTVEKLREMKRIHEDRILMQTKLNEDKKSHILHYGANIGELSAFVTWTQSKDAMFPTRYPAESQAIEISFSNSPFKDFESAYWGIEQQSLQKHFAARVRPRLGNDIQHLSVFAIAPQPLLVELGRLLSDVTGMEVYQHQKEPIDNWAWSEKEMPIFYQVNQPQTKFDTVALNLSLSATINDDRIRAVLGNDVSIWTMTIDQPYNDFLKSRSQLQAFRERFRKLLDEMKAIHGQCQTIHLFSSVPVSVAVEIGRVWMPKADLPLRIYDNIPKQGGFVEALTIDSN